MYLFQTNANVEQLRPCSPFVSTGEEWKARRSELVPALTINKVKIFHMYLHIYVILLYSFQVINCVPNTTEIFKHYLASR